jgi:hypothetical protein
MPYGIPLHFAGVVTLLFSLSGCEDSLREQPDATTVKDYQTESNRLSLEGRTLSSEPMTVEMKLPAATREKIRRVLPAKRPVYLNIDGVTPPEDRSVVGELKLFVNNPKATAKSSVNDLGYVGSWSFAPTKGTEPESLVLDLAPALRKLAMTSDSFLEKPLQFTFILTGALKAESVPPGVSVKIREIHIYVPNEK